MSGTDLTITRRLQTLVGSDATIGAGADGIPLVAPRTTDGCALVLRAAAAEGWKVRVGGGFGWGAADAPADVTLVSRQLGAVESVRPADLVATVQSGIEWKALRVALADRGTWLPIDPPGTDRTLGSLIATATAGPLRSGYGSVRDHLLGLTLVTADGRVVRTGGQVVKNVAGFDLTKLASGSFGAFGLITAAHLRLRTIPRADVTFTTSADRDTLLQTADAVLETGLSPAALEILSPAVLGADRWILAVRLTGADAGVSVDRQTIRGLFTGPWSDLSAPDARELWQSAAHSAVAGNVTIRIGTVIGALDKMTDLICHHVGEGSLMVSAGAAAARWSGQTTLERLQLLRHAASQHEMPVTIERAPWSIRSRLGHFGAYREGVARLVTTMRATFDPQTTLVVPLSDET